MLLNALNDDLYLHMTSTGFLIGITNVRNFSECFTEYTKKLIKKNGSKGWMKHFTIISYSVSPFFNNLNLF